MSTIPTSVTLDELREAQRPLLDLLGTTDGAIYANPGLHIGENEITFAIALGDSEKPAGIRDLNHPQGKDTAELVHFVSVEIVR